MFRPGNLGHIGRLGLVAASRNAFNPLSLFAAGEQGAWYDPSDLSTLFQDYAGTTPVTAAGQPVGRMLDKSGRGNHATQSTYASRPTLQQDVSGLYYLACDGSNDWMVTSPINFSSTDKISISVGLQLNSVTGFQLILETSTQYSANNGAFDLTINEVSSGAFGIGYKSSSGVKYRLQTATPVTRSCVLSSTIDAAEPNGITLSEFPTDISTTAVTGTGGNFGSYPLYLFRRGGISLPFSGRCYGLIIVGSLINSANNTNLRNFMAAKAGV